MPNVSGSITPSIYLPQAPPNGIYGASSLAVQPSLKIAYVNGTGAANLVDLLSYTPLAFAGATINTDLTALLDPYGNPVNFAHVRGLVVVNFGTTPGYTIKIGNAASNAFTGCLSATGTVTCFASTTANPWDGFLVLSCPAGMPVSSTSKVLMFDPGANTFNAALIAIGSST